MLRTSKLGCLLLAAVVVVLAGSASCSAGSAEPEGAGSGAPSAAGFPVTITHKFGSTTIKKPSTRVVSLGITEQDSLLALGVVPIAVRDWGKDAYSGEYVWNEELFGDALPTHLTGEGLNFEQIAGLTPDLIVATQSGITKEDYEKLIKIAPVVAQTDEFEDYAMPMEDQLRLIGEAVGQAEKAENVIQGVQDKLAEVKAANPDFAGKSIVAVNPYFEAGELMPYGKQSRLAEVLDQLGFAYTGELKGADQVPTSYEQLNLLDQDVLVWLTTGDEASVNTIKDLPGYANMEVTKAGNDIFVNDLDASWAFFVNSAISLPYFIDKLTPMLAAATDGDPATTAR